MLIGNTLILWEKVVGFEVNSFQMQLEKLCEYVTRMITGIESPHELSEVIQHVLVKQMMPQWKLSGILILVITQVTLQ